MDKAIETLESQRHTADDSLIMLHADATISPPMEGAQGSRGTSVNDTNILVQNGSLPGLSIDDHSTPCFNACDTSYTKDDWNNDRIKTLDSLKKVDEIIDRKDLQAFKDVFTDPNLSPDVRKEFLSGGTKGLIDGAFGDSTSLHETLKYASGYSFWGHGPVDGKQVETWEKEIESLPSAKTDSMDSCEMHWAEVKQEQKKMYDDQFQADVNAAAQKIVNEILRKQRLFDNQTASQMEN